MKKEGWSFNCYFGVQNMFNLLIKLYLHRLCPLCSRPGRPNSGREAEGEEAEGWRFGGSSPGGLHQPTDPGTARRHALPNRCFGRHGFRDHDFVVKLQSFVGDRIIFIDVSRYCRSSDSTSDSPVDRSSILEVNNLMHFGYMELRLIIEWARRVPGRLGFWTAGILGDVYELVVLGEGVGLLSVWLC